MSLVQIKRVIKTMLFFVVLFVFYVLVVPVFRDKSIERVSKEYSEFSKETFDVIFTGSSVMMNAIYPLQLYEDYGISSFNLGCGSQRLASSYYLIKQALREQKPDLVVLDVYMVGATDMPEGFTHYVTDSLHYPEKIQMILDVLPRDRWIDFVYDLGAYHSRWDNLTVDDFSNKESIYRRGTYGAKIHYFAQEFESFGTISTKKKKLPESQEMYLRKIIKLCQDNNVDIMLTLMPLDYSKVAGEIDRSQWQLYWNAVQDIADEYNVEYLNFMYHYDELNLDKMKDTDGGTHLNAYGAAKLTKYMGKYLKEHYKLQDVRQNPRYDFMETDLLQFKQTLEQLELVEETDIDTYLNLLKNMSKNEYAIVVAVKDIQGYSLKIDTIDKLKKIGFVHSNILLEKKYHSFIGGVGIEESVIEKYGNDEAIEYSTSIGYRKIEITSETLNTGNESKIVIGNTDYSKNIRGLNFVVIDKKSGEIIDSVAFDTHVPEMTCYR